MPQAKTRLRDLVRTDRQMRRVLAQCGPEATRPADLACRPALVRTIAGAGERGCLVFARGELVAVLVRFDEGKGPCRHEAGPEDKGWFLEAGFGECAAPPARAPLFGTVREALAWARWRLGLGVAGPTEALRAAFDYARWLHREDIDRVLEETKGALADAERLAAEVGGDPAAPPPP